jgi:hypothetical protein
MVRKGDSGKRRTFIEAQEQGEKFDRASFSGVLTAQIVGETDALKNGAAN